MNELLSVQSLSVLFVSPDHLRIPGGPIEVDGIDKSRSGLLLPGVAAMSPPNHKDAQQGSHQQSVCAGTLAARRTQTLSASD